MLPAATPRPQANDPIRENEPHTTERAVANLKTWRILHTDYLRPLHTYDDALHAAIGLHWFTTRQRSA